MACRPRRAFGCLSLSQSEYWHAGTLEKSPMRSRGSLSRMFSMVPLGEGTRAKECRRIWNKSKVETVRPGFWVELPKTPDCG